jgi:demethylspheroidene O-methyltransferase
LSLSQVSGGTPVTPSFKAGLRARIDRWMTDPRLYRWALGNPVGRWVSARRAKGLFDLMAGFVHSQVLLACVRLHLLEAVLEQPRTAQELAALTHLSPAGLQTLLDAALALQLLDLREGGRYGLGALGAPVVAHESLRAMIEHNAVLYEDLRDPLALLQAPHQAGMHAYWPYAAREASQREARQSPEQVARYSALMASSQRFVIEELLASYPFGQHRRVLDVGGGQGGWVSELARQQPALQLMLFDLPPVAELAREKIAQAGLSSRISVHGGSFTADELPRGADLVTLLRVAHDHPDAVVLALLKAIHEAIAPGGTLLLAEPMAQAPSASATGDAYFHFYLLAMGEGRLRTAQRLHALMAEAGWVRLGRVANPMPLHATLLTGQKPL